MRFSSHVILVATKVAVADASHVVAAAAEEKSKRQTRAQNLIRGLSLAAEPMCMSMSVSNTDSTNMDDIINGGNEAEEEEDDYKSSVESEPDGGVLSLSLDKLIINHEIFLKDLIISQLVDVKVAGINNDDNEALDNYVDEIMKKFKNHQNSKGLSLVDYLVALSFETVGILGLNHKINEEQSIAILSSVVSKANDLESVIAVIEGGGRRLQTGTNDNLFVAYIQISRLIRQGLDDASILDQLAMMFTERVLDSIAGVLGIVLTPPPGIAKLGEPCEKNPDDCAPYLGGKRGPSVAQTQDGGDPGTSFCFFNTCQCYNIPSSTPVGGCCKLDSQCVSGLFCDTNQAPDGYGKCAPI